MILIVGGGIVGLSTAYWLTKAGIPVTVIEKGTVPCGTAASADHHRLIRYPYGAAKGYCARVAEAFSAWRSMWADLPAGHEHYYAETGMLSLCQEAGDDTDVSRRVMEDLGIPFERIDGIPALSTRFPFLESANLSYGILSEGGALMANRILIDLADWLRRSGAVMLEQAQVTRVDENRAEVVLADGRTVSGDGVVVAAGVGTASLVPALDVPLAPRRTLIVYAEPPQDLADLYRAAPCWANLGGETELWGMPSIDGLPMKFGNGATGRIDPDDSDRSASVAEISQHMAPYNGRFRGADRFVLRWHQANFWTAAPASEFVLERIGKVIAVSACSGHGFKFGALSGQDVAAVVSADTDLDQVRVRMQGRQMV